MSDATTFGKELKKLRARFKLTQREAAKAIGCSDSHLSKIERGIYPIAEDKLNNIISFFDIKQKEENKLRILAVDIQNFIHIKITSLPTQKRKLVHDIALQLLSTDISTLRKVYTLLKDKNDN